MKRWVGGSLGGATDRTYVAYRTYMKLKRRAPANGQQFTAFSLVPVR